MSSAGKRLDLRFGAFACSVRGFDDPVPPVQQILRAIQHLLEESPELSDTAINFDAEAIEQLVGEVARRAELDEDAVEIVPGLIIVHHEGGGDLAGRGDEPAAAWEAGGDAADYVSLFGASGGEATAETDDAADEAPAKFTDRLRRTADEAPAGNGTDYGWDDAGNAAGDGGAGDHFLTPDGAPADETRADDAWQADDAGDDQGDDPGDTGPLNLFADASEDDAGEARGEVRNLFAADSGEDGDQEGDGDALVLGRAGPGEAAPPDADAEGEDGYTAASLAERAEARKVPELMVSAAAFMVLIRGQSRFTRRDVLDVFETIPGDHEKTLEAQIKGFGKAVRNGQLVMIEDGVFGLSQSELDRFQQLL